jgi:hypothetical protein
MELNGLIQVRQYTPLLISVPKSEANVGDQNGVKGMVGRTECLRSSLQVNGLIQIRQNTLLLESFSEACRKVIKPPRTIGIVRGM